MGSTRLPHGSMPGSMGPCGFYAPAMKTIVAYIRAWSNVRLHVLVIHFVHMCVCVCAYLPMGCGGCRPSWNAALEQSHGRALLHSAEVQAHPNVLRPLARRGSSTTVVLKVLVRKSARDSGVSVVTGTPSRVLPLRFGSLNLQARISAAVALVSGVTGLGPQA